MKLITLSIVALGAASLVSCEQFKSNKDNPYGVPSADAAIDGSSDPYAFDTAPSVTPSTQSAPYQQIASVENTLPPTQAPTSYQDYTPEVAKTPEAPKKPKTPSAKPAAGSTLPYVVKSGDSLWKVAKEHGTTVMDIQKANNITGTNIRIGQTLQIPNN